MVPLAKDAARATLRSHGAMTPLHGAARAAKPGSCRGRYHTDRQPFMLQNTAMCPAAPPPLVARAAGQSHSTHDTVIRPGPHSCPFWHRSG